MSSIRRALSFKAALILTAFLQFSKSSLDYLHAQRFAVLIEKDSEHLASDDLSETVAIVYHAGIPINGLC